MKRFIMMLAFALAALANPAEAGEFKWEHPGAAPYAATRDEAMQTRESAFRKLGIPIKAIPLFVEETKKPGQEVKLPMGERLVSMMSKGSVVHRDVVVAWKSPIRGTEFIAPAEKWTVTWEGTTYNVFRFEVCNNWSVQIAPLLPRVTVTGKQRFDPPGQCPDVYILKLRVWQDSVRKLPGVEQTVAVEDYEVNGFSNAKDFSRSRGGQVRKAQAEGNPDAKPSGTPRRFRISFINTDEAKKGASTITAEEVLYDVTVTGLIEMRFAKSELEKWDAIRTVSLDHDMVSPPTYGQTGLHELRFFNHLPGKKLGEWDNNPVRDCIMNEHTIEVVQPVPPMTPVASPPKQ